MVSRNPAYPPAPAFSLAPQPQGQGLNLGGQQPYQMPRVPWGQDPFITTAALAAFGGRNFNEAMQNVAQVAPAGLAAKTAMQRDMYTIQETNAARARKAAAFNAGIKKMSGVTLTPQDEADLAGDPEVALKFFELTQKTTDPFAVGKGGAVYDPKTGTFRTPTGGDVAAPDFTEVGGLRKEIQALPSYKAVTALTPLYDNMVKSAPNATRASDVNIVYGMAKMFDPIGVVREGDAIMVSDTAAIPDWLKGQIDSLNGGARLQPATRNALLAEAKLRVDAAKAAWDQDVEQYKSIAERYKIPLEDVIPNIGSTTNFVPLPTSPVPPDPSL